jgi:hypothetical protein
MGAVVMGAIVAGAGEAAGQAYPPRVVDETLEATSLFTRQDCLGICACVSPPHSGPLTGTFTMRLNHRDQWTLYYDVVDVNLVGMPETLPPVIYAGTGTYEYGGDFALTHRLQLTLHQIIDPPLIPPPEHYDSGYVVLFGTGTHPFPAMSITATTGVVGCTRRTVFIETRAVERPPLCRADFNGDGVLGVQDIFDFLAAYFGNYPDADFNGDQAVGVQDIFDFLGAYFGGCG